MNKGIFPLSVCVCVKLFSKKYGKNVEAKGKGLGLHPAKVSPRITHIYVLPLPLQTSTLWQAAPRDISCFCLAASHAHTRTRTYLRLCCCFFFSILYIAEGKEMAHVCVCPDAGDNPLMSFIWLAASTPHPMQSSFSPPSPLPAATGQARLYSLISLSTA